MLQLNVEPWRVFLTSVFVKILTINTKLYFSTDFEVHRNWLAITHSMPFSEWYREARNQWTLDYPPFFAYFEYFLSLFAPLVDPQIVDVEAQNYTSWSVIAFQRVSVIMISDLILAICVNFSLDKKHGPLGLILTLFSSSLFIVDHIHFQYNGMLLGLLLISVSLADGNRFYLSAAAFTVLVCFKHIYLFSGPIFLVFFLRHFVKSDLKRFALLALIVFGILLACILPIYLTGQLGAMLGRLFPFHRGLVHSYWAPNMWALYLSIDRIIGKLLGVSSNGSPTSGIVGDVPLNILPEISPSFCLGLTLIMYIPLLWLMWTDSHRKVPFTVWVGLGNAVAFLFGWHVHEKALLMVLFPLVMSAVNENSTWRRIACNMSIVTCASMLPLLPRFHETVLKWTLSLFGILLESTLLETDLNLGFIFFAFSGEIYRVVFHRIFFGSNEMEFLPLMVTSVANAVGLMVILVEVVGTVIQQTRSRDRGKSD
jgi:alpha-1,3-glucosyltransferase